MHRLALNTSNIPTEYVEIGSRYLDDTNPVVEIHGSNRTALFRVEAVKNEFIDRQQIGSSIRVHPNIAAFFDHPDSLKVNSDASPELTTTCTEATIYVDAVPEGHLEQYLASENYFLHEMTEVAEVSGTMRAFDVVDMKPDGYSTLIVDDDTEFTFLDDREYAEYTSADDGGERQPATGGEEVDFNLDAQVPGVSFDDVAGLDDIKREVRTQLGLLEDDTRDEISDAYGEQFVSQGNTMLLYGPPGCGKTYVSEAIAYEFRERLKQRTTGEVEVPFFMVKGSDILSKYSGEAEKKVHEAFEQARSVSRQGYAVLFLDEVDTLIPDRGQDNLPTHRRSLTNAFLQEMNELETNLLVIGATNMPFTMDPAAVRRFHTKLFVPQPDAEVMGEVWENHLLDENAPQDRVADDIDFDELGTLSEGYTPAEVSDRILENTVQREVVLSYLDDRPLEIDMEYLREKLQEISPRDIEDYVSSIRSQARQGDLKGYEDLEEYVKEQSEKLGI